MRMKRPEGSQGFLHGLMIALARVAARVVGFDPSAESEKAHRLSWLGKRGHARHQAGWRAEEYAARELRGRGYALTGRNVPAGTGEIDIVAQHERRLVFVEVRARTVGSVMRPVDTVRMKKQRQVIACARAYMREHEQNPRHEQPRYDVAEVWLDHDGQPCEFNVVQDAFREKPPRKRRHALANAPGLQRSARGSTGKWRATSGRR